MFPKADSSNVCLGFCTWLEVCVCLCVSVCVHVIDLAQSGLGVVYSFPSGVEMF